MGEDAYALLFGDDEAVAYGMLRGWDEGYSTPALGIAVPIAMHGRGFGRRMMEELHAEARRRGAVPVRLRVHRDNARARLLYEPMEYRYVREERGERLMLLDLERVSGPRSRDSLTTGPP